MMSMEPSTPQTQHSDTSINDVMSDMDIPNCSKLIETSENELQNESIRDLDINEVAAEAQANVESNFTVNMENPLQNQQIQIINDVDECELWMQELKS